MRETEMNSEKLVNKASSSGSALGFKKSIIDQAKTLRRNSFEDNFDHYRFGKGGPTVPWQIYRSWQQWSYRKYFFRNFEKFYRSYELLEDEASKKIYMDLILYKMLGHRHVKLHTNTNDYWGAREQAAKASVGPSSIKSTSFLGGLKHFELTYGNQPVLCDALTGNVLWSFIAKQYRFSRSGVQIRPEPGDFAFDLGACLGDTALVFAVDVGPTGKVFSFDFMPAHLKVIEFNANQNPDLKSRIVAVPFGVGDKTHIPETKNSMDSKDTIQPGASLRYGSTDASKVPTITLDDFMAKESVEKMDFIKMDIEGFELQALQGAKESIKRFRPKLAISLYHLKEDFIAIPQWLDQLGLGYKFYLNHYTIHAEETVLYAIC